MIFKVRCPNCKNSMLYQPRGRVAGKKKKCVYCGKTFTVHSNPKKSRIEKEFT